MALSAATVWEVRTAGSDTNGGAFVTGAAGTDYSQQDANNTVGSNISTADAVAVGTGVITSVTAAFTAAIVGNIIYLQGGTGALAAGRYQVTVFTNATTITVDRNVAAGTGITMNIGGALLSPGLINTTAPTTAVSGNDIHIKAGTYLLTGITGATGGVISYNFVARAEGYQTVRGDMGTKPLLQASGITVATLYTSNTDGSQIINIELDGASLATIRGFDTGATSLFRCKVSNCTNIAYAGDQDTVCIACEGTGCTTVSPVFNNGITFGCVAHDNSVDGFEIGRNLTSSHCVSESNSGATTRGFLLVTDGATAANCVAYNNGEAGFRCAGEASGVINCISESNTGFGFVMAGAAGANGQFRINCATFGNTAGDTSGTFDLSISNVVGTSTFFTNAAAMDFSLNNVAGGGAAARNAAYPGVLPVGGTGFLDMGALEASDASAGGVPYIIDG